MSRAGAARGAAAGEVHEPLVVDRPKRQPARGHAACSAEIDVMACSTLHLSAEMLGLAKMGVTTARWSKRTGVRRYTGNSSRGARRCRRSEDVEGVFDPGRVDEDRAGGLQRNGQRPARFATASAYYDYQATIKVSGTADREQVALPAARGEPCELDLSGLSEDEMDPAPHRRAPGRRPGLHGGAHPESGTK